MINEYIKSIMDRDPAAKSKLGIILTYPGVKAIFFHRIANFFSKAGFALIARIISQSSRFLTYFPINIYFTRILSYKSNPIALI